MRPIPISIRRFTITMNPPRAADPSDVIRDLLEDVIEIIQGGFDGINDLIHLIIEIGDFFLRQSFLSAAIEDAKFAFVPLGDKTIKALLF